LKKFHKSIIIGLTTAILLSSDTARLTTTELPEVLEGIAKTSVIDHSATPKLQRNKAMSNFEVDE
jgi:hypothetical protein